MQDEKQYEQLMLQYNQLKIGALDIANLIEKEDFDGAITMMQNREQTFLNCQCMRKYLELTPVQQKELEKILDELRELELKNIKKLERDIDDVRIELRKTQSTEKFQNAYDGNPNAIGGIVNIQE